jgi:hypothetical protein
MSASQGHVAGVADGQRDVPCKDAANSRLAHPEARCELSLRQPGNSAGDFQFARDVVIGINTRHSLTLREGSLPVA